ncbi:MAG: hypothetical protein KGL37_13560 [Acidobacteriota bacterium]|nr:hypothetical protein [Acidobacteriota bacterium]
MVVVPLSKSEDDAEITPESAESAPTNWVGITATGTLAASVLLLLAGQRRAGLVAATSGAALALLDQQETVRACWNALPSYLDEVYQLLGCVQEGVRDFSEKREKIQRIMAAKQEG